MKKHGIFQTFPECYEPCTKYYATAPHIKIIQTNVNSIRNKLDELVRGVRDNIDIFISEAKLGDSFPIKAIFYR